MKKEHTLTFRYWCDDSLLHVSETFTADTIDEGIIEALAKCLEIHSIPVKAMIYFENGSWQPFIIGYVTEGHLVKARTKIIKNNKHMTENKLQIEKDRVLAAAAKCPDAKKILETLFPDAFITEVSIPIRRPDGSPQNIRDSKGRSVAIVNHSSSPLHKEKAILLSSLFDWEFKPLPDGQILAIPTEKK